MSASATDVSSAVAATLSTESANVFERPSVWQRLKAHWGVRIGGVAMLLLALIALAAPVLGTVDPTLFDPGSRDLLPGASGDITTLEGESIKHEFIMGSDSFGRDIYSRVIYGTRVSLMIGLACALVSVLIGVIAGLSSGYLRWLDMPLMRVLLKYNLSMTRLKKL